MSEQCPTCGGPGGLRRLVRVLREQAEAKATFAKTHPRRLRVPAALQPAVAAWLRAFVKEHAALMRVIVHRGADISVESAATITPEIRRQMDRNEKASSVLGQLHGAAWRQFREAWEKEGLPYDLFGGDHPRQLADILIERGKLPLVKPRSLP